MISPAIHLFLNHIPILGLIIGLIILQMGILSKYDNLQRIALIILFISAIVAIPTYFTGVETEKLVKDIAWIENGLIEQHRQLATTFLWFLSATGLFVLATLIAEYSKNKYTFLYCILTTIIAYTSLFYAIQTGKSGAYIVRTESEGGYLYSKENLTKD